MIYLEFYDGRISNLNEICTELGISYTLDRKKMERKIIIEGYKKWLDKLPLHLNGYFSFLINDQRRNTYFGARDRFGVIPFYYTNCSGRLFGNCYINELLKQSNIYKEYNEISLQIYLSFAFLPGEQTFYKNIFKLLPGCIIKQEAGIISIEKYHEFLSNKKNTYSEEYYEEQIIQTTKKSLLNMEDQNTAFLLSSGIDSNFLFAMSQIENSFSIGYNNDQFDESNFALKNANIYQKKCERIVLSPIQFFELIEPVTLKMEQPIGSASAIAFYVLCSEIPYKYNACISGEGSDELFAGYEIYQKAPLFTEDIQYPGKSFIFNEVEKRELLKIYQSGLDSKTIVNKICPKKKSFDNLQYMLDVDLKMWVEADSFVNSFKMSRANNLEIRMPFVNEELFSLAYSIPSELKIKDTVGKYILRKTAEKIIPKELAYFTKKGFITPIREWMGKAEYNKDIIETLNSDLCYKFFNVNSIDKFLDDFLNGNSKLWRKIWAIYAFLKWYKCNFE